jgi:hypothetical protein
MVNSPIEETQPVAGGGGGGGGCGGAAYASQDEPPYTPVMFGSPPLSVFISPMISTTVGMDGLVAAASNALAAIEAGIGAMRRLLTVLETNAKITAEEVEEHCKALQRVLIARMHELQGAAKAETKQKMGVLQKQLNELERVEGALEIGIEVEERFKEHGTPIEQLQGNQLVVDGLAAATARADRANGAPGVEPTVKFVVQRELKRMSEMLARYGSISGADGNPRLTVARGTGLTSAYANCHATFVVKARGYDGNPRAEGGDKVEMVLKPAQVAGGGSGGGRATAVVEEQPSKRHKNIKPINSEQKQTAPAAPVVGTVVDVGDGTYQCTYILSAGAAGGEWQLAVRMRGAHIAGSPFAVEVTAGKEFVFEQINQGGYRTAASFDGKGVLHWIGKHGRIASSTNLHTMMEAEDPAYHTFLAFQRAEQELEFASASGGGGAKAPPRERTPTPARDSRVEGGAGEVVAAMSSVNRFDGSMPKRFVMHDHDGATVNGTADTPNPWMSVDLGAGRLLVPTHYCLRHGYHSGSHRLVRWRFEGSNDGATWTVLKVHIHAHANSPLPKHGFSVAAWSVDPPPAPSAAATSAGAARSDGFRQFRIIMTGRNSTGYTSLYCAGIELYGLLLN